MTNSMRTGARQSGSVNPRKPFTQYNTSIASCKAFQIQKKSPKCETVFILVFLHTLAIIIFSAILHGNTDFVQNHSTPMTFIESEVLKYVLRKEVLEGTNSNQNAQDVEIHIDTRKNEKTYHFMNNNFYKFILLNDFHIYLFRSPSAFSTPSFTFK